MRLSRLTSKSPSNLMTSCWLAKNTATTRPKRPPSPNISHDFLLLLFVVVSFFSLDTGTSRTSSPVSGVPSREGDVVGVSLKTLPRRRRRVDIDEITQCTGAKRDCRGKAV